MWEGGALCLVGVAADSGLPLFCRPPRPQLPFSLIGSLNAVHMFGGGAGAVLREATAPGLQLAWGGYGHSITLIALSSAPGTSGPALRRLLDSAFSAMVLVLGLDELVPVRNVERLKRDLRSCFGLIDSLLSAAGGLGAGLGPPRRPLPPGPPRDILQERLECFAGGAQTGLGCLVGGGRLVLATPQWWALPPPDRALLGALLGGAPPGPSTRDLPVYLPHSSPTVPHRLLQLQLLPGVGVALLCGPRPPLQHVLAQLVPQVWGPVLEQLRGCARPPPAALPPGVLAYLLIHHQQRWTQSGLGPGGAQGRVLPPQLCGAALGHLLALLTPHFCPLDEGGAPGAVSPAPPPVAGPPPVPLSPLSPVSPEWRVSLSRVSRVSRVSLSRVSLSCVSLRSHSALLLPLPELLLLLLLPPRPPRGALRGVAEGALRALCPPGTH